MSPTPSSPHPSLFPRRWLLIVLLLGGLLSMSGRAPDVLAQRPGGLGEEALARRWALERELQSIAVVERKVMVPMRDGKRMAADIYRPKDSTKRYPTVFVRPPYNFNF